MTATLTITGHFSKVEDRHTLRVSMDYILDWTGMWVTHSAYRIS